MKGWVIAIFNKQHYFLINNTMLLNVWKNYIFSKPYRDHTPCLLCSCNIYFLINFQYVIIFFLFFLHDKWKEWNGLFNDAHNPFHLLCVVGHLVKNSAREETRCCYYMGYTFRVAERIRLYAPSHKEDSTYHGLCYTSRRTRTGTRNSSMRPPWMIDPTTHRTTSGRSTTVLGWKQTSRKMPIDLPFRYWSWMLYMI